MASRGLDIHQEERRRKRPPGTLPDIAAGNEVAANRTPIPRFTRETAAISPRQALHLQHSAGNRTVARLLEKSASAPQSPAAGPQVMRAALPVFGPRTTPRLAKQAATIQRAGNWDNFKGFLDEEWGEKGKWRNENQWALDAIDPRAAYAEHAEKGGIGNKVKGVGAGVGHSLFGLPFALAGGALSTAGRGLETLGAGAYYGGRGLGGMAKSGLSSAGRGLKTLGAGAYYGGRGLGGMAKSGLSSAWGGMKSFASGTADLFGKGASSAKQAKQNIWDPRSGDQQSGLVSNAGLGALAGVSSLGAGISGLAQQDMTVDPSLMSKDTSMLSDTTSSVGQGFGAGTGILGGLAGVMNTGRGLSNLFGKKNEGKGYQRLTRGAGRTAAGLGQTFAGVTTAGRGISTLGNISSPATQFMASAVIPAQAALSGVDLVRGVYGMGKAFKRQKNLKGLQEKFGDNQELADMARMAKQYQTKRKRAAGVNIAAGVIGGLGAGLTLSGVGAVAGLPLMALAGLLKMGGSLYGTARDKTWGKDEALTKSNKELAWADYAAKNFKDKNVKSILSSMGAEDIALDEAKLEKMSQEERKMVMKRQLMKR